MNDTSRYCVRYRLLAEDGSVLQDYAAEPYCFIPGRGEFFEPVEQRLASLAPGDRERLRLSAAQAFGERDEARRVVMPRDSFDPDIRLAAGQIMAFATPTGEEIVGQVVDFSELAVEVDFNHPLAGKAIVCEFELVSRMAPAGF